MIILGAGMTGVAAGIASGFPIYEMAEAPGGICSSYYVRPGETQRLREPPADGEAYRFEVGGGHWIFGGDSAILHFIRSLTPLQSYTRRSRVYFHDSELYVPFPLQYHLAHLGNDMAIKALDEMLTSSRGTPEVMCDWVEQSFGRTLTKLFFGPFHERYTAGLWARIAPQDAYKSPVDYSLALQGAFDKVPPAGYNTTFVYPIEGLSTLAERMAARCQVHYGKIVVRVDVKNQELHFADGSSVSYEEVVSTLPLNHMIRIAGLDLGVQSDPYTSVLVLNIGAVRGPKCPGDHWVYIPDSCSGFHRVGFYSNVDTSFLPVSSRENADRVSIYVERAYRAGEKPSEEDIKVYSRSVVQELQEWGFIERVDVTDPTWIDVAYTWSWPGSKWKTQALRALEEHGIHQVGRYGRWVFQGIADSIRDGFYVGQALRSSGL